MDIDELKQQARVRVDAGATQLISLSHRIHDYPEIAFEEVRAAEWLAEELTATDMSVTPNLVGLPTALVAVAGDGPFVVAVCAEYDALPRIGHACGHNVIASAAVGVAIALRPFVDELGITLKVFGTPAEESGGGKIIMLNRGAFQGVHAAMMVHPAPRESVNFDVLAWTEFDVSYEGKDAHASMFPERGVNAADALTIAQVSIGLLRQHLPKGHQVHGIITDGGDAANIVPAHAAGHFVARAPSLDELEFGLLPRLQRCFDAGAFATGATGKIARSGPSYSEFLADKRLSAAYAKNASAIGRRFPSEVNHEPSGSTDMANVSLAIPAIHPLIDIGSLPAVNHQADFAAAAVAPRADAAISDSAVAMAWTIVDIASDANERASLLASGTDSSPAESSGPASDAVVTVLGTGNAQNLCE